MEKKLTTSELRIGMYVSRVDRPWIETPFLFQGFLIRNDHDIDNLRRYCKYVYVDESKSDEFKPEPLLSFGTIPLSEELRAIPGMPKQCISSSIPAASS